MRIALFSFLGYGEIASNATRSEEGGSQRGKTKQNAGRRGDCGVGGQEPTLRKRREGWAPFAAQGKPSRPVVERRDWENPRVGATKIHEIDTIEGWERSRYG